MKLEDIKKENIFEVPDRYFDKLPSRIQERVVSKKSRPVLSINWSSGWKVAVPAMLIVFLAIFTFVFRSTDQDMSVEKLLAQVSNEDLIAYLDQTDITVDEILAEVNIDDIELDDLGSESVLPEDVEIDSSEMDALFDEYGIENDFLEEEKI